MAITYQTFSNISTDGGSISLTIPSDTSCVVVAIMGNASSVTTRTIDTASINSAAMTKHINYYRSNYAYSLLSLVSPSVGAQTMEYTYTGTGSSGTLGAIVAYLPSVASIRDTDSVNETAGGGTVSITIDSSTTDYVLGFVSCSTFTTMDPIPSGSGQTVVVSEFTVGTTKLAAVIEDAPGASTSTLSATLSYRGLLGISLIATATSAALPRRALDGPFYGSLRGSVR